MIPPDCLLMDAFVSLQPVPNGPKKILWTGIAEKNRMSHYPRSSITGVEFSAGHFGNRTPSGKPSNIDHFIRIRIRNISPTVPGHLSSRCMAVSTIASVAISMPEILRRMRHTRNAPTTTATPKVAAAPHRGGAEGHRTRGQGVLTLIRNERPPGPPDELRVETMGRMRGCRILTVIRISCQSDVHPGNYSSQETAKQ